jgi:hypothetical protein
MDRTKLIQIQFPLPSAQDPVKNGTINDVVFSKYGSKLEYYLFLIVETIMRLKTTKNLFSFDELVILL